MELKKDQPILKVVDKSGYEGKSKKVNQVVLFLLSQGMSESALKEYIEQYLELKNIIMIRKYIKKT